MVDNSTTHTTTNTYCVDHGYTYENVTNYPSIKCPGSNTKEFVLENLYVVFPHVYVIWKIVTILVFVGLSAMVVKQIHFSIHFNKRKKQSIYTIQCAKLFSLLFSSVVRLVWLFDPHFTSRIWPAPLFGKTAQYYNLITTPLIMVPQMIFLLVLILEIRK